MVFVEISIEYEDTFMNKVIDKGMLILFCAIFLLPSGEWGRPVIVLLLAILAAALELCLNSRRMKGLLVLLFTFLCFFLPELVFFLPVIVYDCIQEKLALGFALFLPFLYQIAGVSLTFSAAAIFFFVLCCILAGLLALRTQRLQTLEQEMIQLRDTSTERNLVLKEKNKDLMEKQDYEIYLATLRERNRIAREIHDHVGHMLSRSILQIGALATIHKEEPLHKQLGQVNDTLNLAMTNIRESVHDLHDDSIDLKQAIMEATKVLRDRYTVTIDFDMSPGVPRNVKYCIISTVKEAVNNIVKHSNANKVCLILREHPGFFQLSIEDNGTNLPSSEEKLLEKGGIGLTNMRERVKALQGVFRIRMEKGFHISFSIPRTEDSESN